MTCPDASKGGRHRWDPGKLISLQAAAASLRKRKYCVAENVKYCICLSLCLERAAPISQSPWLNPAFSSPHFRPKSFSGPFRSCCRLTHIEGVPRPRTVVFLTCVI